MKDVKFPTKSEAKDELEKGGNLSSARKRMLGLIAAGKLPSMMKMLKQRKKSA